MSTLYHYLDIDAASSQTISSCGGDEDRMVRSQVVAFERLIVAVRGQRVIPSADLADIYGVETRVLNQAVKRHADRFPSDFGFA